MQAPLQQKSLAANPMVMTAPPIQPLIPTVFHSSWWLDAASGGNYEEAEVRSSNKVVARMPYIVEPRFAFHRLCHMPEMTHFLGPAIDSGSGTFANQALRRFQLTQEILAQLSSFEGFYHKMHRGIPETLAFEQAGYSTLVQFTYEIQPKPLTTIWSEMRDKTRNVVRRANERWEVIVLEDPCVFAAVYDANLQARGLVNAYTRIVPVCESAIAHGQGCILAVKNEKGAVLGAIFVPWDHQAAYYLLSTRSSEADNGVISLLIWKAISLASEAGLIFDFDGLGAPGSRLFFTGFGGQVVPRYVVRRYSLSFRGMHAARRLLARSSDRYIT